MTNDPIDHDHFLAKKVGVQNPYFESGGQLLQCSGGAYGGF